MKWELIEVGNVEWMQDKSGYYTLINALPDGRVRLDFMTSDHTAAVSFAGNASDVRKRFAQYTEENGMMLSAEHMAYIGYEIARAEILLDSYIQD